MMADGTNERPTRDQVDELDALRTELSNYLWLARISALTGELDPETLVVIRGSSERYAEILEGLL